MVVSERNWYLSRILTSPEKTVVAKPSITEAKTKFSGELEEFDCELVYADHRETVALYRMPQAMQLEDVNIPEGCVSIAYFWAHKPFNAYHWIDDQHRTLALYFNICDNTQITDDRIAWRDLCVDVLITPDARCRVLDEDELPDDIDPQLRQYIDTASAQLCEDSVHLLSAFNARTRKRYPRN